MRGQGGYNCDLCLKRFADKYKMKRHRAISHEGSSRYACSGCDKSFTREDNMRQHAEVHNEARQPSQHPCPSCTKVYSTKSKRDIHLANLHGQGEVPVNECPHCGFRNASRWYLGEHMKIHTGKPVLECDVCGFRSGSKTQLQRHRSVEHALGDEFQCDVCDYKSLKRSHLQTHMQKHSEERFACNQCEKTYKYQIQLQAHCRFHSGERSFECGKCDKTFETNKFLRQHEKSLSHRYSGEQLGVLKRQGRELGDILTKLRKMQSEEEASEIEWVDPEGEQHERGVHIRNNREFLKTLATFPLKHMGDRKPSFEVEASPRPSREEAAKLLKTFKQTMSYFHQDVYLKRSTEEWRQRHDPEGKYSEAINEVSKMVSARKAEMGDYVQMLKNGGRILKKNTKKN